jgi:SOS-response transcriptional repressor LexA
MTPQQAKLYGYLLDRIDEPVAPNFVEMQAFMGMSSKAGVARVLDALVEQGRAFRIANRARSVRAIRPSPCDGIPSAVMIAELKRRGDL